MIPRDFITEWRANAPWGQDLQVEQDLVICRAIVELFSRPELAAALVFRGGTALYKLHLRTPARYSEDIDLVQAEAGPIGPVLNAVHAALDPWLGQPQWKQSEGRVTLSYRFRSEDTPPLPLRLKVEINSREHFCVLGLRLVPYAIASRWFSGTVNVPTYALEEMLGTKLRALYQRKKGRDLFDLDFALRALPSLDLDQVIQCFTRYMHPSGAVPSRAELEANMARKLADRGFAADLDPLLARAASLEGAPTQSSGLASLEVAKPFDVQVAYATVHRALISRLPGAPWKLGG